MSPTSKESQDEAKEAIEIAEKVVDFVKKRLHEEGYEPEATI
jgi:HEPN domain-containing protein